MKECHSPYSGLERKAFDNKYVTFEEHVRNEHNMWHYLYFIVLIKVKDPTEFTGPESYVHEMVKVSQLVLRTSKRIVISLRIFSPRNGAWSGSPGCAPSRWRWRRWRPSRTSTGHCTASSRPRRSSSRSYPTNSRISAIREDVKLFFLLPCKPLATVVTLPLVQ